MAFAVAIDGCEEAAEAATDYEDVDSGSGVALQLGSGGEVEGVVEHFA